MMNRWMAELRATDAIDIGGSKGGARDAPPPIQILSFSCSFRQKFEK